MAIELIEWQGKRLHFVGIGGAGMSGLARIALSHGISVSGSDAKDSTVLSALGPALMVILYLKHKLISCWTGCTAMSP